MRLWGAGRSRIVAERHPKALVITGDPTDPEVLGDLAINHDDAVVAQLGQDLHRQLDAAADAAGPGFGRRRRFLVRIRRALHRRQTFGR